MAEEGGPGRHSGSASTAMIGAPGDTEGAGDLVDNSRDEASKSRGETGNSRGETGTSRSNGSNSSSYRGHASNFGSTTSNSRESASHCMGSADYVDSKSTRGLETGEVDEDPLRVANTMESFEGALPVEKWMQVLEKVPPKDLCNVALTSRHMNSIATTPDLWTRMEVSKGKVKSRGLAQFFKINRFKKIKQIDFSSDFSLKDLSKKEGMRLLNGILGSPLEKVDFSYRYLHKIPAVALSKPVAHLKIVNLEYTGLTSNQLIKVLKAILSSDFLKDVNLARNDLRGVPIDLLCRAVCRLQKVNLGDNDLNAGQCARLVQAIISSESLLDVTLWGNSLSEVSADLLARAVGRLQRVDLSHSELTADQSSAVVEAIISSKSLVEVSLSGVDLNHVPADLLAKAVVSLHTVDIMCTRLSDNQSSAIVEAMVSSNSLVKVDLDGNDLSHVPSHLLDKAAGRLQYGGDAYAGSTELMNTFGITSVPKY